MMINNSIFIKGGSYSEVKKALIQWINNYDESLDDDLAFKLYKNGEESYFLKADPRFSNTYFFFLVNYLRYPENISTEFEIEGFTIGESNSKFEGEEILVYIPKEDTDYDNVYAVTKNKKGFKIDFGGKTTEINVTKTFLHPEICQLENPEIIKVDKNEYSKKNKELEKSKIPKRFNTIVFIASLACVLNLLVPRLSSDMDTFEYTTTFIYLAIGVWFLSDSKMLQLKSFYLKCLIISFLLIGYCFLTRDIYPAIDSLLANVSSFVPLSLLIIQWPAIRIFKKIFKREPNLDHKEKFIDRMYSIVLLIGMMLLAFLMTKLFL